jgi:monothiol glutaredoxin
MEATTSIEDWTEQIKKDIADNRVFVYAKGEKGMPVCGFSAQVMQVFNELGVDYQVRNIFSDPNLRPAICAFSNWPTIPQVFIDGKFIGGCDITVEMYQSGELKQLLEA